MEYHNRQVLIVMRGLPGSGKSSFARRLADIWGADYVGSDALREDLTGHPGDQSRNHDIFPLMLERGAAALAAGRSVVADATHVEPARVHAWRDLALAAGVELVVLRMDTPMHECLRRNAARTRQVPEHVIHAMARHLELEW